MKFLNFTFFLLLLANFGFSQKGLEIIPDQIIIKLEKGADHQLFTNKYLPLFPALSFKKTIAKELDLYLFEYDPEAGNGDAFLQKIQNLPLVSTAGFNFKLQYRATTPDDTFFEDQWDMEIISAPDAWELTTGGLSADNDEIVIAVIEGGDIDHEDVQGNIWINSDEIPDDGIDNDMNDFTDDYYGVNIVDGTDNPIRDSHSTSVMGIMGAKGNNANGVTGVNWDIKLMIVSHNLLFDQIIASYMYVYNERKTYNETNGMEGAFVVATNSSFGVDDTFPEDNPLFMTWCEMYDSLGAVGVLSAAATTNAKRNIDFNGDMPALCPSNYLIAVTETDINDDLGAGYSTTHIDLGAPGKNSYTLKPNDGYGIFGGTSAATPHVSSAIGLLYSLPCKGLMTQAKLHPAETALLVKDAILGGVDPVESLDGMTLTSGRLNLFKSLELLQNQFGSVKGKLDVLNIYPNPSSGGFVKIDYQTPEFKSYTLNIFNAIGQRIYSETIPEFCAPRILNVSTDGWAPGLYIATVGNSNDIKSGKFMVVPKPL